MRKLIYAAGTAAILAGAFVLVQRASPQSNQAKIIWSPPSVYAGIAPTTIVTKTITFTSDQVLTTIRAMELWIDSGVKPPLSLFPESQGFDHTFVPPAWPYPID